MKLDNINWKSILLMMLGMLITAFGIYNVHSQSMITEGGALGLSLLISKYIPLSVGVINIMIDIVAFTLALKILGKNFIMKALFSSLSYGLFYVIFEKVGYILPNFSDTPLIASVLGGLFVGIGVGITLRSGGACGGDDAIVLILYKLFKIRVAKGYIILDFIVLVASISYIQINMIIYSIITVIISSLIIDKIYHSKFKLADTQQLQN